MRSDRGIEIDYDRERERTYNTREPEQTRDDDPCTPGAATGRDRRAEAQENRRRLDAWVADNGRGFGW